MENNSQSPDSDHEYDDLFEDDDVDDVPSENVTEPYNTVTPLNAGEPDATADGLQDEERSEIPSNRPQIQGEPLPSNVPGDDNQTSHLGEGAGWLDQFIDDRDLQIDPGTPPTVWQGGIFEGLDELPEIQATFPTGTFSSPLWDFTDPDDLAAVQNIPANENLILITNEDENQQPDPANTTWWQEAGYHTSPDDLVHEDFMDPNSLVERREDRQLYERATGIMLRWPENYIPERPFPGDAHWARLRDPEAFEHQRAETERLIELGRQSWATLRPPEQLSSWEARNRGASASPTPLVTGDSGQLVPQQPPGETEVHQLVGGGDDWVPDSPSSPSSHGDSGPEEDRSTSSTSGENDSEELANPTSGSENFQQTGPNIPRRGQDQRETPDSSTHSSSGQNGLDTVDGMTSSQANDYLTRAYWRPDSNNGIPNTATAIAAATARLRAALVDTSQAVDLGSLTGRRWAPGATQTYPRMDITARAWQISNLMGQLHNQGCFVPTWPWTPRQNNLEIRGRRLDFTQRLDRICHLLSTQKGICTQVLEGQLHIMREFVADPECREKKKARYKTNNDGRARRERERLLALQQQQGLGVAGPGVGTAAGANIQTGTALALNNQTQATTQPSGTIPPPQTPTITQNDLPIQNAPSPSTPEEPGPQETMSPPLNQEPGSSTTSGALLEQPQGQRRPEPQPHSSTQRMISNNRNGAPHDNRSIQSPNSPPTVDNPDILPPHKKRPRLGHGPLSTHSNGQNHGLTGGTRGSTGTLRLQVAALPPTSQGMVPPRLGTPNYILNGTVRIPPGPLPPQPLSLPPTSQGPAPPPLGQPQNSNQTLTISAWEARRRQARLEIHMNAGSQQNPQTNPTPTTQLRPPTNPLLTHAQRLQNNINATSQRIAQLSQQRPPTQLRMPPNLPMYRPSQPLGKRPRAQASLPTSEPPSKALKVGRGSSPSPYGDIRATVAHPRKMPVVIEISDDEDEDEGTASGSQSRQRPGALAILPTVSMLPVRRPVSPVRRDYTWVQPGTQMPGWKSNGRAPVLSDRAKARLEAKRREEGRQEGGRDDEMGGGESGESGAEGSSGAEGAEEDDEEEEEGSDEGEEEDEEGEEEGSLDTGSL
ncbi:hypothetical protein BU16DRAFT_537992 [Lophium mytilinum]|uniref:Uncharacterized protein n=1 Tax=Lophium mytilinum TaxID=390894 RepID=A0A6A6QXC2_9PEZI|nr:hypothetical protein BU16DRAFT_537992 [Lophium mytilinum]